MLIIFSDAAVYRFLADAVLLIHLGFVLFITLGALLLARRPKLVALHLPAVLWGVLIEWRNGVCPLTPLEQALRRRGGEDGYSGGFIEHYLTATLYPNGLTRQVQLILGSALLLLNVVLYWRAWQRYAVSRRREAVLHDGSRGSYSTR